MRLLIVSAVLGACAVSVLGVCCGCYNPVRYICRDNTECSPYCGRGPCNVVGCNCDGGCREPRLDAFDLAAQSELKTSSLVAESTDDESRALFAIIDTNKDGIMTFDEWRNSEVRASTCGGTTLAMLAQKWAQFDTENKGYLTKYEAITRKPA